MSKVIQRGRYSGATFVRMDGQTVKGASASEDDPVKPNVRRLILSKINELKDDSEAGYDEAKSLLEEIEELLAA